MLEIPAGRSRSSRRNDGATLGIIVILVLTSGFVVGTTATFVGSTTNSGNVVSAAALSDPSNVDASPQGNSVFVTWSDNEVLANRNGGYRVSVADVGAMPNGGGTSSCAAIASDGNALANQQTGTQQYRDANLTSSPTHVNAVDGRQWCYVVRAVYPCCTYGEGITPWVSAVQRNGKMVNVGNTITGVTLGSSSANGILNGNGTDYIEVTFNQQVASSAYPTGYLCYDKTNSRIYVGLDGATTTLQCPKTGNPTPKDTLLSGFYLSGGTITTATATAGRYQLGTTVAGSVCAVGTPTGCWKLKIPINSRIVGTVDPNVGGSWSVVGTANTSYLTSASYTGTTARNFCSTGTSTNLPSATFQYRANPSGGNCTVTGVPVGW